MKTETTELIRNLAKQLGTTTEFLWEVLMKQIKVILISESIFLVIAIITLVFIYKYFKWLSKKWGKIQQKDEEIPHVFISVFLIIISLLFIIGSLESIYDIIICIFNPEYFAVNKIMKFLNK